MTAGPFSRSLRADGVPLDVVVTRLTFVFPTAADRMAHPKLRWLAKAPRGRILERRKRWYASRVDYAWARLCAPKCCTTDNNRMHVSEKSRYCILNTVKSVCSAHMQHVVLRPSRGANRKHMQVDCSPAVQQYSRDFVSTSPRPPSDTENARSRPMLCQGRLLLPYDIDDRTAGIASDLCWELPSLGSTSFHYYLTRPLVTSVSEGVPAKSTDTGRVSLVRLGSDLSLVEKDWRR